MRTIVHIGLGRCATSSLQKNVFQEIPNLRKEVIYNDTRVVHSLKKLWYFNNNRNEELNFQKELLKQNNFISIENLVNWNPRSWEKTADLNLKLFGKDAIIIITARDTESYLRSIYQQKIHEGDICKPEEFLISKENYDKIEPMLSSKILTYFDVDSYDLEKLWNIYNSRFSKVHLVPMNSIDKLEFLRDIFDLNETEIKFLQKNFKKKKHNIAYSATAMTLTMSLERILTFIGLTIRGSNHYLFDAVNADFKSNFNKQISFHNLNVIEKIKQFPRRVIIKIFDLIKWRSLMQSFVDKILPYKKYQLPKNVYKNNELAKKNHLFLSKFEKK